MGLGSLPWELLPGFIGGILLMLIGIFIMHGEPLLSWPFFKGSLVMIVGIVVFVVDLRNRSLKADREELEEAERETNSLHSRHERDI